MPEISIITVVRNGAGTIGTCLASVQQQTIGAEHIVVDGQSTDGTLDILAEAQARNPGLIVISESDKGMYDAMRKGIARAGGKVIGCLNADDFYAGNNALEHVTGVFTDRTVDSCYGDLVYVEKQKAESRKQKAEIGSQRSEVRGQKAVLTGANGGAGSVSSRESSTANRNLGRVPFPELQELSGEFCLPNERVIRRWRAGPMSPRSFHWGWMPPHPTFFVRRSVYERHGSFRLDMGTAADYELMLRFLIKHGISTRYIPEVLVKMRVGGVSNASLRNRVRANQNDRRAWTVNGLRPYPWSLLLKPVRKLGQWVRLSG